MCPSIPGPAVAMSATGRLLAQGPMGPAGAAGAQGPAGTGTSPPVPFAGNTLTWLNTQSGAPLTELFNGMSSSVSVAFLGAIVGHQVLLAPPADWPPGLLLSGYVASANTVTMVATNNSGNTQNIPTGSGDMYQVRVYT
jgi:hypothetical protein